jgi:hypothetical protein
MHACLPRLSPVGPKPTFAIILTLFAAAGCGGTTIETGDPEEPTKVGRSEDPECPEDEPRTIEGCTAAGQVCTYTAGECSHERACKDGVWSFESTKCNYDACPAEAPYNGDPCSEAELVCLYGDQPLAQDAPCAFLAWAEARCTPDGQWDVGYYDSACPPPCPTDVPKDGDPCSPELWAPVCTYDITADCGSATVDATCEPEGNEHFWKLTDPVCQ